jgi:hypothetical protein
MRRRAPDVELLRSLTGYVPSTPLAVTIEDIVASLRAEQGEALVARPTIA